MHRAGQLLPGAGEVDVLLIPIAYVLARYGASVGNSDLVWWCYPLAEIFSLTLTLVFFSRMYKTIIAPLPEGHE